jgi:15-cis-phytoene synthase
VTVRAAARSGDVDRYLAALLGPRKARADLLALAAFVGEIARIPGLVSEPMMGEIRLQWWREALDTLQAGGITGNPVADVLGRAIVQHALPDELLRGLIDARSHDLEPQRSHGPGLTAYVDATDGAAFKLAARILNVDPQSASELLFATAQAYGRARILRNAAREGDGATAQHQGEARSWLGKARLLIKAAPPAILPAILPVALVEPYLAALEVSGPDSADARADISQLTRVWRLWRASVTGRI